MKKFLKVLFITIVLCFMVATALLPNLFYTYFIERNYKQIIELAISYIIFVLIPSISLIKNIKYDVQALN